MKSARHKPKKRKRILFVQLASNGDCLLATPMVKQIKSDNPECYLAWVIGSAYKRILHGNPYVDEVVEVPIQKVEDIQTARINIEKYVYEKLKEKEFDEVVNVDYTPMNYSRHILTHRASRFMCFGKRVDVGIKPIVNLTRQEIENVREFAQRHRLSEYKNVILFETSPRTGQANINVASGFKIAKEIVRENPNTAVILSSDSKVQCEFESIIDGSQVTLRENVELSKYCTLLIGCSSGISWITTAEQAKELPAIQILNERTWWASMVIDNYLMGLPTEHIIEISDENTDAIPECVKAMFSSNFREAKRKFHTPIKIPLSSVRYASARLLKMKRFRELERLMRLTKMQYGAEVLLNKLKDKLLKCT